MAGGSNPPSATTPLHFLADAVGRGFVALGVAAEATVVLAVSGGPDSMAMLHGTAELVRREDREWHLTVAHLDHGLRPESADDAAFVSDAAATLALRAEVRRVDVAALARETGRSLEEAGRGARYAFLESVAQKGARIATAHTLDDAVETVLLNLLRGSGLAGARGIPARRGRVIRPLLQERRGTLRELLDAAGLPYRDDPSNADPAHLRNRVRAEIVPLLESLRPGATDRIARFSALAAEDDALLDALARAELESRRSDDGSIDWHDPPGPALARRVLRLATGDLPPSAERIEALLEGASGVRGGIQIELGGGRTASVRERRIRIG